MKTKTTVILYDGSFEAVVHNYAAGRQIAKDLAAQRNINLHMVEHGYGIFYGNCPFSDIKGDIHVEIEKPNVPKSTK